MAASANAEGLITYSDEVETAVSAIESHLRAGDYGLSSRSVALLCLQGDEEILERVGLQEGEEAEARVRDVIAGVSFCPTVPMAYQLMLSRSERARELVSATVRDAGARKTSGVSQTIGKLSSHPVWGFPI